MPRTGLESFDKLRTSLHSVGRRGLEPPTLAGYAPQAYAYTNSATGPIMRACPAQCLHLCGVYHFLTKSRTRFSATSARVPKRGLEPPRVNTHSALNGACLPIPAPGPEVEFTLSEAESDSAKSKGHFGILSASTSALRNFSINDIFAKAHVNSNTHYQYFVLGVYNRL